MKEVAETKEAIADVLAERYASRAMIEIWSPRGKVRLMRELWVAALRAQRDLGRDISDQVIAAYAASVNRIDLDSIAERELVTKQDVKANIEEFNAITGVGEYIHEGFTSRDATDNVEQLQIYRSLKLVRDRTVAVLYRLGLKAAEYTTLDICGRSHNIPGQTTTLGKRFGNWAQELILAFDLLENTIMSYRLRGIKGAMGTQQDMIDLLGRPEMAVEFEDRMRQHLGMSNLLYCVGQVYPRSMDFEVVSVLMQLASAPANFANMVRLMAGHELAFEGFSKGQSGSTAMPHKMNSRTCERINGLTDVLGGFQEMAGRLVGKQWFEGDVSCSVVRRVALPGAFFAIDGIYESTMTVLDEMKVFPAIVKRELDHYLPFLSTTRFLMAVVKKGMGREEAHRIIKEHAIKSIEEMREAPGVTQFISRLAQDENFPLDLDEIKELLIPNHGNAEQQVDDICFVIFNGVASHYPKAIRYNPEPIR